MCAESLSPAQPTVNDMIGAEIIFNHENRFLYPNRYTGIVQAYEEDRRGEGYLTVKSPSFNLTLKIHESYLKGYVRSQPSPVAEKAETAA